MPKNSKKLKVVSLRNIKSRPLTKRNEELSEKFIDLFLLISGLEIDHEGYLIDSEIDSIEPEYIQIKGRVLRRTNNGILHKTDMILDPYNNTGIMEELFNQYIRVNHNSISATPIIIYDKTLSSKNDNLGYIKILYSNGSVIQTADHYRDSTKYLDAYMRLESMTDDYILDALKEFDEYEKECYDKMMDEIFKQNQMLKGR